MVCEVSVGGSQLRHVSDSLGFNTPFPFNRGGGYWSHFGRDVDFWRRVCQRSVNLAFLVNQVQIERNVAKRSEWEGN